MILWNLDPVLGHGIAAALSALLLIGAIQKLESIATFTETVAQYQLVPESMIKAAAWLFPVLEAIAGAVLLMPDWRALGALLGCVVLATATAAVAINVKRGRTHFDCGCGMGSHTPVGWALVGRNAVLMLLMAISALPVTARELSWLDAFAVLCATLFWLGTYFAINTLLANAPRLDHLRKSL